MTDHSHPPGYRLTSGHLHESHPDAFEQTREIGLSPKQWHDREHAAIVLTDDQARMLALGWLTAAANALTMGGSADEFAYERVLLALPILEGAVRVASGDVEPLAPPAEGEDTAPDIPWGEPRSVVVKDEFTITGRGQVYVSTMPDPPYQVNEVVLVSGQRHVIIGIERYALAEDAGLRPGMPVGLLCRPETQPVTLRVVLSDPGAVLPRDYDYGPEADETEPLTEWQVRAVAAWLRERADATGETYLFTLANEVETGES